MVKTVKARFGIVVAAVVVATLLGSAGVAEAASPVVVFADAKLKACVLSALGSPGPEVTASELQGLTELSCTGQGVVDIAPLAQAKSLTMLDLSQNELADLGPVSGLADLETLDVSQNRLQSLGPLRGLASLTRLQASYNSVGALGDLSALGGLESLDVSHNSINAASGFFAGTALRDLDLSFNLLSDAQFASRLVHVDALILSYNRITSAVPVGGLSAQVDLRNQAVTLSSVPVDTLVTLPVVRNTALDPVVVRLTGESQAYGYPSAGGFTWRSNGVGQLAWDDVTTLPAGNVVTFTGRFTQAVSRGTLTAPTPTISGSAVFGSTLTAVTGTWGPAPVALTYQWKRDGNDIPGATNSKHTLSTADIGTKLSVAVTGTKSSYSTATTVSGATGAVVSKTLTATPTPTISGTAAVGTTLTATPGAWSPSPVALSYQWRRGGSPISGATAATYTPTNSDAGSTLTVSVTGTKSGYTTVSTTSGATAAVSGGVIVPVTPTISGALTLGGTLTAVKGSWTPTPIAFYYRWKRNGVDIPGATKTTYVVTADDLGTSVTVTVKGMKSGFETVQRTSAPAARPK